MALRALAQRSKCFRALVPRLIDLGGSDASCNCLTVANAARALQTSRCDMKCLLLVCMSFTGQQELTQQSEATGGQETTLLAEPWMLTNRLALRGKKMASCMNTPRSPSQ